VSLVGTWMQTVAQSWLVYRITGSSLLLGLVGFAGQIPVFLLSPVGGVVADRWSRHRIVLATQTTFMLLALGLAAATLGGDVGVGAVMAVAALMGIVNAFDVPARQALIVELVPSEDMLNAIALNSSMVNSARILGPAIAGITVAAVGEGWCFLGNGLSYLAVLAGLLLMRLPPRPDGPAAGGLESLREGFRFVRRTGPIRALLLLLGLVSLTGMPYTVLMPVFADRILHGGPQSLGLLMGASGVGALAGTLILAARRRLRGLGRWVTFAAFGFGTSMCLFSLSRSLWLSVALLVPVGFSMMLQMAASNTLIQAMVPDHLRGRVLAVYAMMFMGMAPFGALIVGVLASRVGAPLTVALGGLACVAGSLVFARAWPALRGEARQLVLAQGMHAGDPPEQMTQPSAAAVEASASTSYQAPANSDRRTSRRPRVT
jgi:MFS family permease